MTVWLRRREAVTRFQSFLQWIMPEYREKLRKEDMRAMEDEDGGEGEVEGDNEGDEDID
ncbi:hypothetical protein H0H92_000982, partial [Tricholoma furcatifolium]